MYKSKNSRILDQSLHFMKLKYRQYQFLHIDTHVVSIDLNMTFKFFNTSGYRYGEYLNKYEENYFMAVPCDDYTLLAL